MANVITCLRILGSICILFLPTFSAKFYTVYILCGLSDIADGAIARKTGTESRFGSVLDTAADIIFTAVCLIKLLPVINIPVWLWAAIVVIAAVKLFNILYSVLYNGCFTAEHTIPNKITGFMLFLTPFILNTAGFKLFAFAVCCMAFAAAVQELYLIRAKK